jgi:hypothetical protein
VDGAAGNLRAHTSGDVVSLRGLRGNVDASTSGGSIEAEILKQLDAPASCPPPAAGS